MILSKIHSLIKKHSYFSKLSNEEILSIYENALHSVTNLRTETIDLLSEDWNKVKINWDFDEKLGLQKIDAKLKLLYPNLTENDRILLYNIVQSRISYLYTTGYELNTNTQNAIRRFNYLNELIPIIKLVTIIRHNPIYEFGSSAIVKLISIIRHNPIYQQGLSLKLTLISTIAKTYNYIPELTANVKLLNIIKHIYTYKPELTVKLRLVSSEQRVLNYQQGLTVTCKVIGEFDESVGFTYIQGLTAKLSLE